MQVIITQLGSVVMVVHPDGLSGEQWGEAIGIGLSIFVVDALLKLVPDDFFPKLGQDSNDDRRIAKKRGIAIKSNNDY
jgi:hypothetical protein